MVIDTFVTNRVRAIALGFCCAALLAACSPQPPVPSEPVSRVISSPAVEAERQPVVVRDKVESKQQWLSEPQYRSVMVPVSPPFPATTPIDGEVYAHFDDQAVRRVLEQPVSTFSVDVDTGSYSNVRRMLREGRLPPRDAVRVEEMLNYFDYAYAVPDDVDTPFRISTEIAPSPWNHRTRLLRIGIQGYQPAFASLPPANLVFLVDVSGSMRSPDKLDLLKNSLKLLVKQLREQDRIALVVYAGASGVVLEPTPGSERVRIEQAIDGLAAGGSTNGGAGIRLAYAMARQGFIEDGINRVLLATDGDFNVGTVSFEALKDLVASERASGVTLTTLGFGGGNYNDRLMEQLADTGDGQYAYIDSLMEARKLLVQQLSGTLQVIARDVKIQLEFNPVQVSEYRLIGYENRALRREDFNNDRIDAGEIGAGHTVTALYEISLTGYGGERVDPLRYQAAAASVRRGAQSDELAWLRLRYKPAQGKGSRLLEQAISRQQVLVHGSDSLRFAAAVAGFGQLLRGGHYLESFGYDDVLRLARGARGTDAQGYRGEFLQLVGLAQSLAAGTMPVAHVE